jgi:Arc/MetJ-type ribon-helix-helix transcriptional regulator
MTNALQSAPVPEKPISVRLDEEASRALAFLMRDGASQSDAIRQALLGAARTARTEQVRADAERVGKDPKDRAVIAEIRAFMDELAPPG